MSKNGCQISPKTRKNGPWSSTKTDAWKHTPNKCLQNNAQKNTPKPNPKSEFILVVGPLLRHLWWPKPLLDTENRPPALPKCSQLSKINKKWYQRAPRLRKRAPKVQLFPRLCGANLQLVGRSLTDQAFIHRCPLIGRRQTPEDGKLHRLFHSSEQCHNWSNNASD